MLTAQREGNSFNEEYKRLEGQAQRLRKQLGALSEELEVSKLEPDEMQKRMLAKVMAWGSAALSSNPLLYPSTHHASP